MLVNLSSKRVNRKNVEKGNNTTGRAGTLRCDACRRRKSKVRHFTIKYLSSKCAFQSEDVACEFCRARNISAPCIKKWGRKKEEQLSKTISTAMDETFPSEYVSLLQKLSKYGKKIFYQFILME